MHLSLRAAANPTMLLCVALALLLAHGTPSLAATANDETRSVAVRTSDLDLDSEDGRKELNRRISRAARYVCGSRFGTRDVWANQCAKVAAQNARRSVRTRSMTTANVGARTIPVRMEAESFDLRLIPRP